MEFEALKERYVPLLREHWVALVLGFAGFSFICYGLMQLLVARSDSSKIAFQSGENREIAPVKSQHKEIMVDVEGAVLQPGIHILPAESRIQDALISAGGMSAHADRQRVAKSMNLAAKVIDGGKIYIPFEGDTTTSLDQNTSGESTLGLSTTSVININTATETQLDSLSGVGPSTAQKIINGRPYSSVDELLKKKIVGKSVFEKIKEKVTVQ